MPEKPRRRSAAFLLCGEIALQTEHSFRDMKKNKQNKQYKTVDNSYILLYTVCSEGQNYICRR